MDEGQDVSGIDLLFFAVYVCVLFICLNHLNQHLK